MWCAKLHIINVAQMFFLFIAVYIFRLAISDPSPVSPKEGEVVCLLAEKVDRQCLAILQQDISRTLKKRTNWSSPL